MVVAKGRVVLENGASECHLGISGGRIAAIIDGSEPIPIGHQVIDAKGRIVLPGGIEPHCHFWDPGEDYREGWESGTRAAAAGGMTTVIEMPLATPPTVDKSSFSMKLDIAQRKSLVDFALWGGVIPDSAPELEKRILDMRTLGAVAYKVFMCWSAQTYPPIDDALMLETMRILARHGLMIGIHAENESIIRANEARLKSGQRSDPMAFIESRPPEAELEAISRALTLGRIAGAGVHIVHMSIAEGASLILKAKQEGQNVSLETAPQYLALSPDDIVRKGPYAKCAPPLRSKENALRLWERLLDGTIDFIGSDHAPFTRGEKDAPASFWDVPNGLPGIQDSFSILFSEGVVKRGMSLERLSALMSGNAARRFGLYPRKGSLRIGSDADFVIVDPNREWTLLNEGSFSRAGWTPYEGMKMRGRIEHTILRGQTVFANGQVISKPGSGQFVKSAKGNE